MRVTTSKSKNAESFYISKGYVNDKGVSTSVIIRKLGTLKDLLPEHGPTRDDVMVWAKEQARIETLKYKREKEEKQIKLTFHADRPMDYDKQVFYRGGYLFLQSIYYQLQINKICRKLKQKHKFKYDINAILSDLIYARILEPCSKRSSYKAASEFLEKPSYKLHDVYRALDVLGAECDLIQAELYKNSHFLGARNDKVLYYDCSNYYFEIEQEDGDKKYGKCKQHRPNPIIQMGLFMDGDGIPLAFSTFRGASNEQPSMKPLEEKIIHNYGLDRFVVCTDGGLGSDSNRLFNNIEGRAFITTQSLKKLKKDEREAALNSSGWKRLGDGCSVNIQEIKSDPEKYASHVYYKIMPYSSKKVPNQMMIVTYSPKYALYQCSIREKQIERAGKMIENGSRKKEHGNQNDPARFIKKTAVTDEYEVADRTLYSLDEEKIESEMMYDGYYAICTDLVNDSVEEIIRVSEQRWEIEESFRIMKTEFQARPVYLSREDRIQAHFLICYLSLMIYRILEKKLKEKYTAEKIITTLRKMELHIIPGTGYQPSYTRTGLTDELHEIFGFNTDYQIMTKSSIRNIIKLTKQRQ